MTSRILALGAVCYLGLAQAQEYQYRSEVFGGAGLRLTPWFGIEFDFNTIRNRRTTGDNSIEFAGHGFLTSGSGLLYLRRGRIQPYPALIRPNCCEYSKTRIY